jgi:hypothetical protein
MRVTVGRNQYSLDGLNQQDCGKVLAKEKIFAYLHPTYGWLAQRSSHCYIAEEAVRCPKWASEVHIIPIVHCTCKAFFTRCLADFMIPPRAQLVQFIELIFSTYIAGR